MDVTNQDKNMWMRLEGDMKVTTYTIPYPNGENRGVKVEAFKDATETYIRERIEENIKYPIIL